MKMPIKLHLTVLLVALVCHSQAALAQEKGKFYGNLSYHAVEGKERVVKLITPFSFKDPRGKIWVAPAGAEVDGATIPPSLWSIVGAPFTGKYREASVIHDYYCWSKSESWQDTHKVFYEGMIANGVSETKAYQMYMAVYWQGPRWIRADQNKNNSEVISGTALQVKYQDIDIVKFTSQPGMNLEKIEAYIDKALEISDIKALQRKLVQSEDCSVVVASIDGVDKSTALCQLNKANKKLLAKRNLKILIGDVETLLSANNQFLIPEIDNYITNPSEKNWKLVTEATDKVRDIVNLTMLSLIQHDEDLKNAAGDGASGEFLTAGRLKQLLSQRSVMLEMNVTDAPHPGKDLKQWKLVYLELLKRLGEQLKTLQTRL